MLKNIFLVFFFTILIVPVWSFFLKKTYYLIPKLHFYYSDYENQDQIQTIKDGYYIFKNQKRKLDKEYIYSFSNKPIGYVRFKKTGKEIDFFLSETNQIFWTKEAYFYPYLEPYGNFLFGINSDRTQIEVMDINGKLLYTFNGIFLVDLQCLENYEVICIALFSDGKVIFLSKNFFKEHFFSVEKAFFKSFRFYKDTITFHYYKENQDVFVTYLIKNKKEISFIKLKEIVSNISFPYTIPFCKLEKTILFPNFNSIIKIQENTIKIHLNPYQEEIMNQEEFSYTGDLMGTAGYFYEFCTIFHKKNISFWSNNGNFLFNYKINSEKIQFYSDKNFYVLAEQGYLTIRF